MKKTIFFLLGVLLASALPGKDVSAQSVVFNVEVHTLDRAAVTQAYIYAATPNQTYYVDGAHLNPTWSGSGLNLVPANYTARRAMGVSYVDGKYTVTCIVDSVEYENSFIVVADDQDRRYVLGGVTRDGLDTGYFYTAQLTRYAVDGFYSNAMSVPMTLIGTERAYVMDKPGNCYSSLDMAIALCADNDTLSFLDTIHQANALYITRPLTIIQSGMPVVSTYSDASGALVNVSNTTLFWYGNNGSPDDIDMTAGAGDLFALSNASFHLRQFDAVAPMHPVVANDGSMVTILSSTLGSVAATEAVVVNDSSDVTIHTLTATTPVMARMSPNATGILSVLDSVAALNNLDAEAYYRGINTRKYRSSLALAAASTLDTVFLNRNIPGGDTAIVGSRCIVNLNGDSIMGTLIVANTADTVILTNGVVNVLAGADGATGTLIVNGLDSVGLVKPNSLDMDILDGRFKNFYATGSVDLTVEGGKYDWNVAPYLAPRHTVVANTDADSAAFHYKVAEGYRVTFVNYNGRIGQPGYADSVVVYDRADNRIVPAPSRPSYVGSDTIFLAYFVDSTFRTPWNFMSGVLTSDTVLYAQWHYGYNSATQGRYIVRHQRQDIDGSFPAELCDTTYGYKNYGDSLIVFPNVYVGFHADRLSDTNAAFTLNDTVINFTYVRDSFQLVYRLHGGMFTDGGDTVATYAFGDTIDYSRVVLREGYAHAGWAPMPATMPAYNGYVVNAIYTRNDYPLTWSHQDTVMGYDGVDQTTVVYATYVDDFGATVRAILTVQNNDGDVVSAARAVGTYGIFAAPADTNYHLTGALSTSLQIVPAGVNIVGVQVDSVKLFDGSDSVVVTNMGAPSIIYGSDDLRVVTTAKFNNASVAEGKTITAYFTLEGADVSNYALAYTSKVITTNGAILAAISYDATQGDNGIGVNASGYCSGDASGIQYYLTSGIPDQYKLVFDQTGHDNGFTDVNWSTIATTGTVDITIPANAAAQTYNATLTLRNSNHPTFESAPIAVTFLVNLSRNLTMPIFNDVISIVDTCHCIDHASVKWYHNGTYVGDGPYYQEIGGLTGSYHAQFSINGQTKVTCEQTDLTTIVPELGTQPATVNVYPNPTVDQVSVSIDHPEGFVHTLRVMNVMGMTLVNTTFEGDETVVDFSGFGVGSYTVSVDGIVVRVIKK